MWNSLRSLCCLTVTILLLLNVPLICSATTPSPTGSLQFTITFTYAVVTVHGKLENAAIYPNNSVSMMLTINDQVMVHGTSTRVMMNGTLEGMRSDSTLTGQMNLVGEDCIQVCGDVAYVGKGQWSGALNQTHGAGTLQGTITITKSSFDYAPVGATGPFTGTWSTDFQLPVPELTSFLAIYVLAFAVASVMLTHRSRKTPSQITSRRDLDD